MKHKGNWYIKLVIWQTDNLNQYLKLVKQYLKNNLIFKLTSKEQGLKVFRVAAHTELSLR